MKAGALIAATYLNVGLVELCTSANDMGPPFTNMN